MGEIYPYAPVPENLPWPDRVCCSQMLRYRTLNSECVQHGYNCPDRPITWTNGDYLIRSPNGEYRIKYCPWCGRALNNEVKYPKKITREEFNQLLCHDCARPLNEVMCSTCCECKFCMPDKCEPKYHWMVEENPGFMVIYGSTSIFAPRHTEQPASKTKNIFAKIWQWLFSP